MLRPLLGLALVLAVLPTSSATHQWTTVFLEEFDGPGLDPAVWTVETHTGSVVVSGGAVTLTGGTYFPTITTTNTLGYVFPAGETFRATIDYQYLNFGSHGLGIHTAPFFMWQDTGGLGGTQYAIASGSVIRPADNARHVVVFEWDGARARVTVDGTTYVDVPSAGMPDRDLGFGNPTECCPGNPGVWNNIRIYSAHVERLTPDLPPPVPELPTLALAAVGLAGVAVLALRSKK